MTRRIILLFLSVALTGIAWAKPQDDDEPYTRLARLSYIEGSVSYQHATDVDWAAASVNLPLQPGDRIYTSSDGRAEIEFDDGSVYRLARNTDVEILSLRDELIQMRVLVGLSTLIATSDTDFEINTPSAAFNTLKKGTYRFSVEENGDSEAIVRKGKLEAANNDFSRRIESGEMLRVAFGSRANPEFARYERRDAWDEWNDRRNADLNAYGGRKYLPDTVYIGVSDLHRHGRWVDVEYYGSAWVPYSVGVYWSPYSVGRWCYRPLFGWTWISYEPWGWLPYHYGRWYRSSAYGWCWLPGPSFGFNFWSPGLVAFYNGPGWVSWCPLGPGDYYDVRHYHFNRGIYRHQIAQLARLNTRERGHLFNRDAPHAFRTASIDRFRDGNFRGGDRDSGWARVDQPWKRGELVRDSLNIRPTATSYRAAPDRQSARPTGTRALPAVVRSSPAYDSRGQDHYTRISNPKIPALPSRAERARSDDNAASSGGARPAGRVFQTPQRERTNTESAAPTRGNASSGTRSSTGRSEPEQSGRRMTTPQPTRPADNGGNNSDGGQNVRRGARQDAETQTGRPAPSRGRGEAPAPPQKDLSRTPPETRPNNENRQQSKPAEPRSRPSGGSRSESPAIFSTPKSDSPRTYYYRGTVPSPESDRGTRAYSSRAYADPSPGLNEGTRSMSIERSSPSNYRGTENRSFSNRSYPAPAYSAPSYRENRAGSASIGGSRSSGGGNSSPRIYSAPSPGRSSGGSSALSGGGSAGRSGGGGAPRSPDRGSSGGGRGRR